MYAIRSYYAQEDRHDKMVAGDISEETKRQGHRSGEVGNDLDRGDQPRQPPDRTEKMLEVGDPRITSYNVCYTKLLRLVVITGVSGSGKSSLAFDTIYAEGQRRYVESLSAYARQFLEQMEKPDVDAIEGLSPAISIEQKS